MSTRNNQLPETRVPEDLDIKVISSIKATTEADGLVSENLQENLAEYEKYEHDLWADFLECEPSSIAETKVAKRLADFYLLKNASEVQFDGVDKALWSKRFTESSEVLYGTIDKSESEKLIRKQLAGATLVESSDEVITHAQKVIKSLLGDIEIEKTESRPDSLAIDAEAKRDISESLFAHQIIIAETINELESEGPFNSGEVRSIFNNLLSKLKINDSKWDGWTISNTPNKDNLSVVASEKRIDVPDGRPDVATRNELLGLAMHEIGVHATRAASGYEHGDRNLAVGITGYLEFEEGLGILAEYLASGRIDHKHEDRYVDVALATGVLGKTLSREELTELFINREIIRSANDGNEVTEELIDTIRSKAQSHVTRIFRGGDGRKHMDSEGNVFQAIYVKDIVYYEGFLKAQEYFARKLKDGAEPSDIWEYLLSGKFDPNEPSHVNYLKSTHNISI